MIPASIPIQRPADAKLLAVGAEGRIQDMLRSSFPTLVNAGDVIVANDAATLPAGIFGVHQRSGQPIEVRLAGGRSVSPEDVQQFSAVVLGEGNYRTPTELRPSPPELRPGDTLQLGPLTATVLELLGHHRLVMIRFEGPGARIWEGLARHGHPIQYSHISTPLAIWDTWTPIAGPPVAFEPPSAGFALDWSTLDALHRRGVHFATITHAAGISSTGDEELDARLPFDEPYRISDSTARLIRRSQASGGRVIAIGTTVVRALEHAVYVHGSIEETTGLATNKIGSATALRVVDAVLSGAHEPGTSHHHLLSAFVDRDTLFKMDQALEHYVYRTHEFGDSVFVEKSRDRAEVHSKGSTVGLSREPGCTSRARLGTRPILGNQLAHSEVPF
jgi:S-adenosylmethionine:tRNA ribosyltransferase-isomerase